MLKFLIIATVISVCPPEAEKSVQISLNERQAVVVIKALRDLRERMKEEYSGCNRTTLPEFYISATVDNEISKLFREQGVELPPNLK